MCSPHACMTSRASPHEQEPSSFSGRKAHGSRVPFVVFHAVACDESAAPATTPPILEPSASVTGISPSARADASDADVTYSLHPDSSAAPPPAVIDSAAAEIPKAKPTPMAACDKACTQLKLSLGSFQHAEADSNDAEATEKRTELEGEQTAAARRPPDIPADAHEGCAGTLCTAAAEVEASNASTTSSQPPLSCPASSAAPPPASAETPLKPRPTASCDVAGSNKRHNTKKQQVAKIANAKNRKCQLQQQVAEAFEKRIAAKKQQSIAAAALKHEVKEDPRMAAACSPQSSSASSPHMPLSEFAKDAYDHALRDPALQSTRMRDEPGLWKRV